MDDEEDHYRDINRGLYLGQEMDEQVGRTGASMRVISGHLDAAIAAGSRPDEPHRLYRGTTPPSEVIEFDCVDSWARETYPVGSTHVDLAYTSSSHCPEVAVDFSGRTTVSPDGEERTARHRLVFEQVSRRGAATSAFNLNEEHERLMPRRMAWRVVGVHVDVDVAGENSVVVQFVDVDDIFHP